MMAMADLAIVTDANAAARRARRLGSAWSPTTDA